MIRKPFPQMVSLIFLVAFLAACAKLPQESEAVATPTILFHETEAVPIPTAGVWHLVVISESSGLGLGQVYADQIEKDVGVKVVVDDFAIGGNLTAGVVLQALETGKTSFSRLTQLSAALKQANVVLMFANPMDSVDKDTRNSINNCFASTPPTKMTPNAFEKYTTDLKAIWFSILKLRSGQPTVLRAMDVANPFVSSWQKNHIFDDCTAYWEGVSTAVRQAAEAYHIPFLSRYDAFNGRNHDEDLGQKGYLISDGVHPNNVAIEQTVKLLSEMGYDPVPAP